MEKLDWFAETLKDEFDVSVEKEKIGYEATELYVDELDNALLPAELLEGMPERLILETVVADDEDGNEWIGMIGCHPENQTWLIQTILRNGEPVLRNRIDETHDKTN